MVHAGATGLVDDWRTKIVSPHGTASPRSLTLNLRQTADHNTSLTSPTSSFAMSSYVSTPSPLGVNDAWNTTLIGPYPPTPGPFGGHDAWNMTAMGPLPPLTPNTFDVRCVAITYSTIY